MMTKLPRPVQGPEITIRLVLRPPTAEDFAHLSAEVRKWQPVYRDGVLVEQRLVCDQKLVAQWLERLSGVALQYLEPQSFEVMGPCCQTVMELLEQHRGVKLRRTESTTDDEP